MLGTLVLGLSGSNKVGLLIVAGAFILFAAVSSFVLPERWPEFPGKSLGPFIVICSLFFVGMMLAVFFLAKEEEEPAEHEEAAAAIVQSAAPAARTLRFDLTRG